MTRHSTSRFYARAQAAYRFGIAFFTGVYLLSAPTLSNANPLTGNAVPGRNTTLPAPAKMASAMQASKLLFTENRGQVTDNAGNARPDVLFTAHSGNTRLYLTGTGIHYQFTKTTYPKGYNPSDITASVEKQTELEKQIKIQTHHFSLELAGGNPHPVVLKENKNTFTENFYTGSTPEGITGVATYEKVVYKDVYPHIDWIVYSNGTHLKYDFLVHPGGNAAQIKLKIKNADEVSITTAGELLLQTSLGEVREQAPVSFTDGSKIPTHFKKNNDGTIGFDVKAQPGKELRIDPAVIWATYYGGTGADIGYGCATDSLGNVFLAGTTGSPAGIASGGLQTTIGGSTDAFLAKFDSSGYLLWATYYGGTAAEQGYACATDRNGNIYMQGLTASSSGIASGGVQNTIGGNTDIFLVKFNGSGTRQWATYYGGTGAESLGAGYQSLCTDNNSNVYMIATWGSVSPFTFSNAFQPAASSSGSQNAFVVKFDSAGNQLWGTFYTGTGSGQLGAYTCAADNWGNVYIAGGTSMGSGIATSNVFQSALNGTSGATINGFLVKFNPALPASQQREWATYYGGTGTNTFACVTDASGVYIAGNTSTPTSASIASANAYQPALGGAAGNNDGFLAKFDTTGHRIWGTYYGSTGTDYIRGACKDPSGNICISGLTTSTSIMSSGGFQNTFGGGGADILVAKFDTAGNRIWGSYYGAANTEQGQVCASDRAGNIYVVGQVTAGTVNSALPGSYQSRQAGGTEAILVKIGNTALYTGLFSDTLCAGISLNVPFTLYGTYNSGNTFTAQLSDASGSFANPVNIGTLSSTAAGSINATIPANTPVGTHYRIRIHSSNPALIAPNNDTDLVIKTGCCIPTRDTVKETVCITQLPITWNGKTVISGGPAAAIDTLVNASGCDSIVTLNLVVNEGTTTAITNYTHTNSSLTSNLVYGMARDAAGNEWFGTLGSGLCKFDGTTWTTYTTANGLANNSVQGVTVDRAGNIWIATRSGISRFNGTTFTNYTITNSNLVNNNTYSITFDAAGNAWIGTGGGVSKFDGTTFTNYTATNGLPSNTIYYTTIDAAGNKWFSTTNGVSKFDGTAFTNYSTTNGLGGNTIRGGLVFDALGNAWIATDGGVSKFDGTTFTNYTTANGLVGIPIQGIGIDPAGNIWAGTTSGISVFDRVSSFTNYTTTNGLAGNVGLMFNFGPSGTTWIATTGGVSKLTNTCICTPVLDTVKDTICASQLPFTWNGKTVTAGGIAVAVDSLHNTGGCDSVVTLNLMVKPQPAQPSAFTDSSLFICQGQTNVIYKVPNDTSVTYTWSYSGNGGIINGNTDSVTVNYNDTATSGTIQVTATNACGISAPRALAVTVNAIPVVSIAGNAAICTNGSTALIASGATTYSWSPSATLSSAAGDSVQASPTATTTYTITGTTNGCSDTATTTVTVNALPKDTVTVYAPGVVCPGSTLLLQTLIDTGYQYQWQLNGTDISTATSAFYSADSAGSYDVRITAGSGAGCTITTHQVAISAAPAPIPVITYMGNGQLCASGFASYQWYMNGTALAGDTSSCVTVTTGGDFTVTVTSAAGCSGTSPLFHLNTGVSNVTAQQVKLYPNPATSIVNISAPQNVNVSLSSIDGRELMHVTNAKTLNISALPNAVYLIKVYDQDNNVIKVEKLVKAGW